MGTVIAADSTRPRSRLVSSPQAPVADGSVSAKADLAAQKGVLPALSAGRPGMETSEPWKECGKSLAGFEGG